MVTERIIAPEEDGPAWLPADPRPIATVLLLQLSALAWIGRAWFAAGWAAGYAAGVVQPWVDARGWVVLLFLAIGVPVVGIWWGNR